MSVVTSVKAAAQRSLPPSIIHAASTALDHSLPSRRRNLWWQRQQRAIAGLIAEYGPVVQSGPFRGLQLPTAAAWGNLAPLLVGSYERELHGVIEKLIALEPPRIVNVGSAEGYYAVGLARRVPDAMVFAFDIDPGAQAATRDTARLNGVLDRIQIAGRCTPASLGEIIRDGTLILADCEGCEAQLLRPDLAPALRGALVLVELHDFLDDQISTNVLAAFRRTHSIRIISAQPRDPTDYPLLARLKRTDRQVALNEARPDHPHPMQWGVLCPLRTDAEALAVS
jgi:hypothetical protein